MLKFIFTGKEVQKRWKSLRDCFRREVAIQKKTPSGSGFNKRRKYMYFDQLQFLTPTLEQRQTTSSVVEPDPEAPNTPVSPNKHKKSQKRQSNTFEKDLLQILEKKASPPQDEDDDNKQFLLSLLPTLKSFQGPNNLLLRVEIMNTIRKLQQDLNNQQQHAISIQNNRIGSQSSQYQCTSWQPQSSSWQPQSTLWCPQPSSSTPVPVQSPNFSEPSLSNTESSDLFDLAEI